MEKMMSGITIDFETADRITLANLQEQRRYLLEEIRLHVEEGQYLHPQDYHNSMTQLIPALELLIPYYGGTL
jgi:hypothetical protein